MKKIILLFTFLCFADAYAQLFPTLGSQRAGISTAQFLKIGVGGRATAMGDAFVAVSNDVSALYWNPAGIVQTEKDQAIFSHNEWLVDIKHEFFGAIYHFSSNDAVGVSFTALHMDDMKVTTEFMPFGTGEYFSFGDIALAVTYARKMTDQFSFGGTVRYIEETLDVLKMRGFMIDLGTYYWTGLGSTRFAVTITNFGGELRPKGSVKLIDGSDKSDWQAFSPPTMFRIGFAMEPFQDEINRITTSIQLNHPSDNSENVSTGVEYSWREIVLIRAGYKINVDEQDFSVGIGLNIPTSIAEVTVDYSYSNFERLGSAHRISLILGL
ncbi:MAG: PorV/PorQ family protein [Ignavibacteriales bacterium]|nr:PorV/PorQ family protein [Ignavibacteriales bacterium]